jgi:hypothetical protein
MSQVSDPNDDAERVDLKSLEVRTESGQIDFDRLKLTLGACAAAPASYFSDGFRPVYAELKAPSALRWW